MRTSELHKLREERTRHLQQLDELQRTKALLEKANARVEDLTVQLAAKTELERYFSFLLIDKLFATFTTLETLKTTLTRVHKLVYTALCNRVVQKYSRNSQ